MFTDRVLFSFPFLFLVSVSSRGQLDGRVGVIVEMRFVLMWVVFVLLVVVVSCSVWL